MDTTQRQHEIEALERAFWDSIVAGEPRVATEMLTEPAVMVSGHGATKFDHATYTRMATDDTHKLVDYTLSDMDVIFPRDDVAVATYHAEQSLEIHGKPLQMSVYDTSTWVKIDGKWRCVMHTESPLAKQQH